ncbi:MAG: cell division FtsA domain-containing protein [Bacteroidales bacterium]|nr:cell division FtsA domain-containing protein [Bacteroidales bacterium]MDD6140464.1 cell division FtsA domain-containing protein [Bacteroidales bacterium]MDD6668398.1 cell division FtsA domain-containing protein [Bacteroidales bacterium]
MDNNQYIVALEIASSHVSGAASTFNADNRDTYKICSFDQSTRGSVRYGSITNVEELFSDLRVVVNKIQQHKNISPRHVSSVFIGVDARSVRSEMVVVEREINEGLPVSSTLVESILREAENNPKFVDLSVLKVVPKRFEVDGKDVDVPVGSVGSTIRAEINVIVCRQTITKNINLLLGRMGLKLAGLVCVPLAVSNIILSEEQKRLGCALVDIGADTTSVSVYKDNRLESLTVLPMGSHNITRDLTSLNLLENIAERCKKAYGVIAESDLPEDNINGVRSIDVARYIKARAEEIVVNVINQIRLTGLNDSQLPAGIVLIGRGSKLNNLCDLFKANCKMPVSIGSLSGKTDSSSLDENVQLLSILDAASETMGKDDTCLFMPTNTTANMPVADKVDEDDDEFEDEPELVDEKAKEKSDKKTKKLWGGKISKFLGKLNDVARGGDIEEEDDDE